MLYVGRLNGEGFNVVDEMRLNRILHNMPTEAGTEHGNSSENGGRKNEAASASHLPYDSVLR